MILPGLPWLKLSSALLEDYGCTGSVSASSAEKHVGEEQADEESEPSVKLLAKMFTLPYVFNVINSELRFPSSNLSLLKQ